MEVSVFRFQLPCFFFLTPDTRHLKPLNMVLGVWDFISLQYSNTPVLQSSKGLNRLACLRILN